MIRLFTKEGPLHPLLPTLTVLMFAASAAHARSDDRTQSLTADADRNDCIIEDGAPCKLLGNVHIRQGTLDIRAERADLRLAGGEVQSVQLSGTPVHMTQETDTGGTINASAHEAHYDIASDTLTLTQTANVQQPGRSLIAGERIVYNTRTHQVQGGGDGSRVRLQFEPQSGNPR